MTTSYGAAANFTAQFAGPFSGSTAAAKIIDITIPGNGWKGAESPYSQVVEVEGVAANSIVDLAGDSAALKVLSDSRCAVYLENDSGTVTAVAVGGKPKSSLTLQAIIREGVVT